ncbi:MAG TPA: DUF1947 domain-containing protein [Thermoplasmataceae archaeon]|nr:DUF1947 domain-containing protein [Thermoplasmatales archaeon AK]HLH85831.1 DUF1947 domain-containing protein [Thermoplasmataceae archaeon]
MARHFISKKESRNLAVSLSFLGLSVPEDGLEVDQRKGEECYFYRGKPYVYHGEQVIPTLYMLNDQKPHNRIVKVDDGAVPHVVNGANVFAQGIISMDQDIKEGDMVFVANSSGTFIAVGIAVRDAKAVLGDKKGTAVKIIHHPGDRIMQTFS